ncbi:dynamin family protein [Kitasatospora sp. NPDC056327]|uniref:dynamin family protein n=1 Tax=Kitasatospora sp. NPDC056327 TaxID=3345785 RepID=UPI0035D7546C
MTPRPLPGPPRPPAPPVPSAPLELPVELARGLAHHHGSAYRALVRSGLEEAAAALARPTATVVFGGHFSAGKSSVLNLLIGRPLLPVSDFPETGVACVIRRGAADRVTVGADPSGAGRGTDGPVRELPCTTEAIADAVTLLTPDGSYRLPDLERPRRVLIELADAPLPPGSRWTDSPGINDLPEMTARAAEAAEGADVLVWVVNSRQPLSTVEEDFLHEYRERHGPDSVAVLVNVFLTEDTPERWQHFLDHRAHLHRQRLEQALGGRLPAELAFVSARAALADPAHYGGPEARALVARLTDGGGDRADAARRHRAALLLRPLAEEAALRARGERARLDQVAAEAEAVRSELAVAAARFRAAVESELDRSAEAWPARTRACADQVVARLAAGPVIRDGGYGTELTGLLRTASHDHCTALAAAVSRHADRTGRSPLDGPAAGRLAMLLRPLDAVVEVPGKLSGRLPEVRSAGLGGTVSRRLGSMMPSLSAKTLRAIDSAVNSAADTVQRARDAAETAVPDRERTQANVREAAAAAVRHAAGRREAVLALIFERCRPLTSPPAAPDPAPLAVLDELSALLARFTAEAERTGDGGPGRSPR